MMEKQQLAEDFAKYRGTKWDWVEGMFVWDGDCRWMRLSDGWVLVDPPEDGVIPIRPNEEEFLLFVDHPANVGTFLRLACEEEEDGFKLEPVRGGIQWELTTTDLDAGGDTIGETLLEYLTQKWDRDSFEFFVV